MLSFIFSLLSSLPSIVNGVTDVLKKRADAEVVKNGQNVTGDTQVNLAVLNARLEELKLISAQRAADRGSLWTEWMMPALFVPCFVYLGAIIFDSMCLFGHPIGSWKIAALPDPYNALVAGILGSVAGLKVANDIGVVVKKIFSK